jgi:redox-sensitive bicupin YhaK (pirin superfamily)
MITIRPANERGGGDHGWLDTRHTFSFSDYYDPRQMGFRTLRVINEDTVAPGAGFGTHGHRDMEILSYVVSGGLAHRDMEILSYVVSGGLAHRDSTGKAEVLRPHEWQRMTAGTGVRHSEMNASKAEPVHFYQIWILPEAESLRPEYEQKLFAPEEKAGKLRLVASRDAREGSLKIHQDVSVYNAILKGGDTVEHRLAEGRHAWLQVVRGAVELNGTRLGAGDGAAVSRETALTITAGEDAEVMLFDLA